MLRVTPPRAGKSRPLRKAHEALPQLDGAGQRLLPVVCQGEGGGSVILVRQAGKPEPLISEELATDLADFARVCTVTTDSGFVLGSSGGAGWAVAEFASAPRVLGVPAPYVVVMSDSGIAGSEIDWGGRTRDILGLLFIDDSGDEAIGRRFDALRTERLTALTSRERIVDSVKLLLWQPWRPSNG